MDYNDVWRVTARMTGDDGVAIQNVWFVRKTTIGVSPDDQSRDDIAGALDGIYDSLSVYLVNDTLPLDIQFYDVTNDTPMPAHPWSAFSGGASGNEPVPSGVAYLIVFNTGVKRVQSKKYFGQCDSGYLSNGNWNSTLVTGLSLIAATIIENFVGPTTADAFQWGVVDKLGAFWDWNEAFVKSEPAYQRRRRFGTGI